MLGDSKAIQTTVEASAPGQKRPRFQFSIRWLIFSSLILASVPPLFSLYKWMERSAIQKEIAYVDENHLVIASNLAAAMERYADDVAAVFELTIKRLEVSEGPNFNEILDELDLSFVTVMDEDDVVVNEIRAASTITSPPLPSAHTAVLRAQAAIDPSQTVYSGILQFDGAPHLFLARTLSDSKLAVAALKLRYLIELQQSIKFGVLGHSMIVDQNGLVIAHPNPKWQASSKDASKLSVVQQMMARETGVATFYSPPMQADMISGFTFVPRTGWGVMVPQPMSELVAQAKNSEQTTLAIVSVETAVVIALSWWLSHLISRPILNVVATAQKVSGGNLAARVTLSDASFVISEAQLLGTSFNQVISHLQADRNQLTSALDAALEGERAKSRFLSVMSHEVRTPMHGLMGILELIEDGELEDGQRRLLTVGQKAAKNMVGLLDSVLQFVRMEAHIESSKVSEFNPADVARGTVDLFQPLAMQKGLSLTTSVSDKMLQGDPQMISQILQNLVGNAVKFTDEGQIHIASKLLGGGTGTAQLILSVSDSGIGIAKDMQASVFDEFTQVNSGLARTRGGSGLGLAISSRLAKLMMGGITLESEPNKGSRFQLNIPVAVVEV
jgi:signal transduction histidine kinase